MVTPPVGLDTSHWSNWREMKDQPLEGALGAACGGDLLKVLPGPELRDEGQVEKFWHQGVN